MLGVMDFYTAALLLAVLITAGLGILGVVRRERPGAMLFTGLMFSGMFYALGSIFEIRALTTDAVQIALGIEYLGIATVGPFWFLLAQTLTVQRESRLMHLVPILFILPVVTIALVLSNGGHHLYFASIKLTFNGPFTIPVLAKGPWYWIHFAFMNLCILSGSLSTLQRAIKAAPVVRQQAIIMFTGSLLPWVGMVIYPLGMSPYGLDISPFGMTMAGMVYAWGLFRYRLLDLAPLVHENVFAAMRDGVLVIDIKGRLIGVNPACSAILPEITGKMIGEDAFKLLADKPELLSCLAATGQSTIDLAIETGAGTRHFQAESSDMKDHRGRSVGIMLSLSDISARVELLTRLERLAATDSLTGLSNRRNFLQHAPRELARARRQQTALSLIMLDLDHFKAVNDRFGHQAGDAVLIQAASICSQSLRMTDLACRYGGEEFLILLPGINPDGARMVAERIRVALETARVDHGSEKLGCTASFGITGRDTVGADIGLELEDLIREADAAMYRAKETGRNRICLSTGA